MRLDTVILLIGALALSQPAFGEPDAPGEEAAPMTSTGPDDNEIVCRKERVMGSMIPVRTCTTRKHERELREASQDALQQIQRSSTGSGGGVGEG